MSFLENISKFRNPLLTDFFLLITRFGEEYAFLIVTVVFLWCINKKCGYCILFTGILGQILNNFLKLNFKVERPWVANPNFEPVKEAISSAGGYSFPSGHTKIAVTTYGPIANTFRKNKTVFTLFWLLIFLISFSRLYLGVHYLSDVLFSLVLGIALVILSDKIFRKHSSFGAWRLILFLTTFFYAIYAFKYVMFDNSTSFDFFAVEFSSKFLGAVSAFCISWYFDEKIINYSTKGPFLFQVFKIVIGVVGIVFFRYSIKILFEKIGVDAIIGDCIRYFIMVLFAGTLWPYVFNKIYLEKYCKK